MLLQKRWQLLDGHPIHPRASFIGLDSFQCLLAVFPLADFLHQLFGDGRAFDPALSRQTIRSLPEGIFGASPLSSSRKANTSWFFCRLSSMSRAVYSPLPLPSLRRTVWAFIRCQTTTPAADFCRPVRMNRSTLSPDFRTNDRSPEVSSTAFRTQPPEFTTSAFDGYGLRGQLPARPAPYASNPVLVHRLVRLLHASFRPRLATTPLRFAITSPPSGCQGDFHPRAVEHARHTTEKSRRPRGRRDKLGSLPGYLTVNDAVAVSVSDPETPVKVMV